MASSAWHINQMGPPYRSGVWACIQSSVRWWSFRSHGGACSCRFLVDNCLQIKQTQRTPENANRANTEGVGGGTGMRQPIRGDAADGRHHCRCHLRSLEYRWLRNQPAHWRPRTQLGVGSFDTAPSRRCNHLIAWTCEHRQRTESSVQCRPRRGGGIG